ncbi:MAG TPA: hypothetical protein VGF36_07225, partial [Rhodopila sp.]
HDRPTFHGYAAATIMRPEWRVQFLVFQAGMPHQRTGSLTGGGQIPVNIPGSEGFAPWYQPYAPGLNALVGGGQMNAVPAEIIALLGGQSGTQG